MKLNMRVGLEIIFYCLYMIDSKNVFDVSAVNNITCIAFSFLLITLSQSKKTSNVSLFLLLREKEEYVTQIKEEKACQHSL
jgi:hypothetical protein